MPARVAQVADERRRAEKRADALESELARLIAQDLVAKISDTEDGKHWAHHLHRTDDSPNAVAFLGSIAAAFAATTEEHKRKYALVLSSAPSAAAATNTNVVLLVGSDDAVVKSVGEGLKSKLGIKGGGKGAKWSGKHSGVWREKENVLVGEVLREVV